MRKLLTAAALLIGVSVYANPGVNSRDVVLPSSKLIGCMSSGCSQVWPEAVANSYAVYPQNISIDIDNEGVLGMTARYDKSTRIDDVRSAIQTRYGKWIIPSDEAGPVFVWRVDSERVSIQLAEDDDGSKKVIYLSARAWQRGKSNTR